MKLSIYPFDQLKILRIATFQPTMNDSILTLCQLITIVHIEHCFMCQQLFTLNIVSRIYFCPKDLIEMPEIAM